MTINAKSLEELARKLTPQARSELRDFAEFLLMKQKRTPRRARCANHVSNTLLSSCSTKRLSGEAT